MSFRAIWVSSFLFLVLLAAAPRTAAAATQTFSLVPGFNFVGLTVAPTGLTSQSLMTDQPAIVGVYRYDQSSRRYVSQLNLGGGDFDGVPFDLVSEVGYILRATAATSVTISGAAVSSSTLNVSSGFALVAFGAGRTTSRDLMGRSAAIVGVYQWDPVARRYFSDLNLGGGDFDGASFDLVAGTAYVVRATAAAAVPISIGRAPLASVALLSGSERRTAGSLSGLSAEVVLTDGLRAAATGGAWSIVEGSGTGAFDAQGRFHAITPGWVRVAYAEGGATAETFLDIVPATLRTMDRLAPIDPDQGGVDPPTTRIDGQSVLVAFQGRDIVFEGTGLGSPPVGATRTLEFDPIPGDGAAGPSLQPGLLNGFVASLAARPADAIVLDPVVADRVVLGAASVARLPVGRIGRFVVRQTLGSGSPTAISTGLLGSVLALVAGDTTLQVLREYNPTCRGAFRWNPALSRFRTSTEGRFVDPSESYVMQFDPLPQTIVPAPALRDLRFTQASTRVSEAVLVSLPVQGVFGREGFASAIALDQLTPVVSVTPSGATPPLVDATGVRAVEPCTAEIRLVYGPYQSDTYTIAFTPDPNTLLADVRGVTVNKITAPVRVGTILSPVANVTVFLPALNTLTTRGATGFGVWSVLAGTGNGVFDPLGAFTATAAGSATIAYTEGGVVGTTSVNVAAPTSLTLLPNGVSVPPGSTLEMRALVAWVDGYVGYESTGTWSVVTGPGSITSSGLLSVTATGPVTVRYELGGVSGTTIVTGRSATPTGVAITPAQPIVRPGSVLSLSAELLLTDGSRAPATSGVWRVRPVTGHGTITQIGQFLALVSGTVSVEFAQEGVTGAVALRIPAVTAVSIQAATNSVSLGMPLRLTPNLTYDDGGTGVGLAGTWSLQNITGAGTIDLFGLFTPTRTGSVRARYTTSGTSGEIALEIRPQATLLLAASTTASVAGGGTVDFTATAVNIPDTEPLEWLVDGVVGGGATTGTIVSTGSRTARYTAPATVGTATSVNVVGRLRNFRTIMRAHGVSLVP